MGSGPAADVFRGGALALLRKGQKVAMGLNFHH
jgi:hypothetical protein